MKRLLVWWYGVSWLPITCIGGWLAGRNGAGIALIGALLVNGLLIAAYEFWYPPTIR